MERLLQGRQSGIAYDISMNTELGRQKGDAKLSLFRDENGLAKFDLHFIRQAPKVGQEYRGYKLEEDVLDALNRTGNAGGPGRRLPQQGDETVLPFKRSGYQRDVLPSGRPGALF